MDECGWQKFTGKMKEGSDNYIEVWIINLEHASSIQIPYFSKKIMTNYEILLKLRRRIQFFII